MCELTPGPPHSQRTSVSCWLCDADNAQLPPGYTVGTEEPEGGVVGELGGSLSALQDTPSPSRITPPPPLPGDVTLTTLNLCRRRHSILASSLPTFIATRISAWEIPLVPLRSTAWNNGSQNSLAARKVLPRPTCPPPTAPLLKAGSHSRGRRCSSRDSTHTLLTSVDRGCVISTLTPPP